MPNIQNQDSSCKHCYREFGIAESLHNQSQMHHNVSESQKLSNNVWIEFTYATQHGLGYFEDSLDNQSFKWHGSGHLYGEHKKH